MRTIKFKLSKPGIYFLFAFFTLMITSCNSSKNAAGEYTEIVFGSGGGVTGAVEEYHLMRDGTLKKGTEVLHKINKSEMNKINRIFGKVDFKNTAIDDPSNIYYFMGYSNSIKE